jgi:hypothetical protein
MSVPAFPGIETPGGGYPGMSLRDYFAASVMSGLAANQTFIEKLRLHYYGKNDATRTTAAAEECYRIADAMLKAREAK